ncbi:hypothetical protein [Fluviispira sanaruensis]|uniref:Uncharacterized protein n=1 Tax=Fluviispira sanaruensis TaxID=2493639 RepID=A0A4P2VJQ1_FLUSA|nr:hypothetical protein [Fluviispira sanaruensis]BBH52114.1 hypothetical protein JCM31447_05520 [Fluviispira sanaruensis]
MSNILENDSEYIFEIDFNVSTVEVEETSNLSSSMHCPRQNMCLE